MFSPGKSVTGRRGQKKEAFWRNEKYFASAKRGPKNPGGQGQVNSLSAEKGGLKPEKIFW